MENAKNKGTKKILSIVAGLCLLAACSKKGGGETPAPEEKDPAVASLSYPAKNSECLDGTVVSGTESKVTFKWNAAANADSYVLAVKDLKSKETKNHPAVTGTEKEVTLKRGNPYSWHVISKSKSVTKTAKSATWNFYNAGPGTESRAPFPAELKSPAQGAEVEAQAGKVKLEWEGSDLDNDIDKYDVFFGEALPSVPSNANVSAQELEVSVASGKTYHWKVRTKDKAGNSSTGEAFRFKVK